MGRQLIFVGDDLRMKALEQMLEKYKQEESGTEIGEKFYVLPTPVGKLTNPAELIRAWEADRKHKEKILVFGGMLKSGREIYTYLTEGQIPFVDFMELEEVLWENAHITAEGTIAELLLRSKRTIRGERILITGYGRCAQTLAGKVRGLEGLPVIVARSQGARQKAKEAGYEVWGMEDLSQVVMGVDVVVNTVPDRILEGTILERMRPRSLVIDLASLPGGTDFARAKELGIEAIHALGLPSRYAVESGAKILGREIEKYLKGEGVWTYPTVT